MPLVSSRIVAKSDAARASRTPSRRPKAPTAAGGWRVSAAAADSSTMGTSAAALVARCRKRATGEPPRGARPASCRPPLP
eukprot:4616636-Prymnesium_polylepis.1